MSDNKEMTKKIPKWENKIILEDQHNRLAVFFSKNPDIKKMLKKKITQLLKKKREKVIEEIEIIERDFFFDVFMKNRKKYARYMYYPTSLILDLVKFIKEAIKQMEEEKCK